MHLNSSCFTACCLTEPLVPFLVPPQPKRFILAGWNASSLPDICAAFSCLAPEGSTVTLILPDIPEDAPGWVGGVRFKYVQSSQPTSLKALQVGVGVPGWPLDLGQMSYGHNEHIVSDRRCRYCCRRQAGTNLAGPSSWVKKVHVPVRGDEEACEPLSACSVGRNSRRMSQMVLSSTAPLHIISYDFHSMSESMGTPHIWSRAPSSKCRADRDAPFGEPFGVTHPADVRG